MERSRVLTVAELIHGGRPLTAADSLQSNGQNHSVSSKSSRSDQTPKPCSNHGPNPNPNPIPRVLTPLDFPAIVVGTVTLPVVASEGNPSSNSTFRCSFDSCFRFSDGSAEICCDILGLDLGIIGKKINVLAWNFVPIKRGCGFLEIIRWSFSNTEIDRPRSLATESFSLGSSSLRGYDDNSKSRHRHRLHGILELVSPISVNPCSSGVRISRNWDDSGSTTSNASLRGFLVRLRVCKCGSEEENLEQNGHSFTKPVIVYFCGSGLSWHPVITKRIGTVVSISGLKKKLVYLGHEDSHVMHVTTEESRLRILRSEKNFVLDCEVCVEREGECGSYTGVVKGVYLQGMVVELDDEVWLLLTNQLLTAPHSLRVGALISVRNVHLVNPKFSWTKMLILGACYKTSITVERFSPLMAGVLLLVSCFRKKFHGILSEKEILGTKNKEGLVQLYATAQLSSYLRWSSENQHRGVFMSMFKENSCCCEEHNENLKLVVPILTFVHCCDAKWMRTVDLQNNKILCDGKSYGQSVRRVFTSEDTGIVLIGCLKISPSSGRLQLVDTTGEVDVLVPDFPTCWNPNNIYEVVDYSLVIDGIPRLVDHLGLTDKSFSCRTIFNFIPGARVVKLRICVHFHLRNAACRNISLYPHAKLDETLEGIRSGSYHLLQLTHKFPMLEKFPGDTTTSNAPSMFAEAVIFCWNLSLSGEDGFAIETTDLEDLKNHMEHRTGVVQKEQISKRPKTENVSRTSSGLVDVPNKTVQQLRSHYNFNPESAEKRMNRISCSATIRAATDHRVIRSVILQYTRPDLNGYGVDRSTAQKVILEFECESFYVYQSLQIGCYYITEHDKEEDCFCKTMDANCLNGIKIPFSSNSHLWSVSFACDVLPVKNLSNHPPSDDTCSSSRDVFSKDRYEVCLSMSSGDCVENSSDVFLSLPATSIGILKVNMNELEEVRIKSAVTHKEIAEVASGTRSVLSSHPLLPNNSYMLPEGNIISLRGNVVAVHNVDAHFNCQNLGDSHQSSWESGGSPLCLHVLVHHRTVKICGSTSYAFPPGFGPGVDVTFHQVLELGGQDRWLLTPVSFIEINSIRLVNKPISERSSCPLSEMNGIAAFETFPLGLISELVQHPDFKLMRIRCRVVAVNILVFETSRNDHLGQKFRSRQRQVDIPMAGFVLDDGSSLCCCWVNAERAGTFLRLQEELPMRAFASNDQRLNKRVKMDNSSRQTIRHRLGRILQKHTRITVKNFGSLLDSSHQDLVVSVSSDKALNRSDESFLKLVVLNACLSSSWTVVASLMDSNSIDHLEKQHNLLEMNTSSMENIWAKEVHHTNPLTEAQTIIQELLDSGPVEYTNGDATKSHTG